MRQDRAESFSMLDDRNQTANDRAFAQRMEAYFTRSIGDNITKLRNFPKYVPRQSLSLFLAKNEIFHRLLGVHGHIIECGVFVGGGIMTWAQLSAIYEPVNHIRKIVGFDMFTGFPSIHEKDRSDQSVYLEVGSLSTDAYDDVRACLDLYDANRPLGHIPRVELVVGDALKTIPEYLEQNKHLVVAMLYLDFDLYEPTKVALETFLPRMPKGSILAFDELDQAPWPGETLAVLDTVGLSNLRIERFAYVPQLSYAVLD
jgi:hypothetical protein